MCVKGLFMQRNLQPWITTGVALVGASLIAVTPMARRCLMRSTDSSGSWTTTSSTLSQLVSTTEANWSGLETVLGSSNWLTDPDISQGLSTLFSDLSTGTSNPVTNPIALLTEGALLLTQQQRRVQRRLHRANGRHGQRRICAQQRRLLRGAHRPRRRTQHGPVRIPQRLPGNPWLRADFTGPRTAHQHC